jgi:hypothetical protein
MAAWMQMAVVCVLAAAPSGCSLWGPPRDPAASTETRGQLVVHCDVPLPAKDRLIAEIEQQGPDLSELLNLPTTTTPIHIHLFQDAAAYQQFVARRYPHFPERRAFFVETDEQLAVYAHWGESVADDLRHEAAHGYLHAAVPNLPLWLDEGLAEFFEVGRQRDGFHETHLALLAKDIDQGWRPNLTRLEELRSAADMNQRDYAESWAWVHILLRTTPARRELLQTYLAELRHGKRPGPLSARLAEKHVEPERTLVEYLQSLRDE